jgi:hypothetical protein
MHVFFVSRDEWHDPVMASGFPSYNARHCKGEFASIGGAGDMISLGVAITGGVLWLSGQYALAFWFVILSIISGLGAVVKAIANPHWYAEGRARAGLETDFFNPSKGIGSLIVTKIIATTILGWCAWRLGQLAGYFT